MEQAGLAEPVVPGERVEQAGGWRGGRAAGFLHARRRLRQSSHGGCAHPFAGRDHRVPRPDAATLHVLLRRDAARIDDLTEMKRWEPGFAPISRSAR